MQTELGLLLRRDDINAACSGFMYGLVHARDDAIGARKVLSIGTDSLSRIVDWEDRNTAVLFGDGSGAVVLEGEGPGQLLAWDLDADGSLGRLLYADGAATSTWRAKRSLPRGSDHGRLGNQIDEPRRVTADDISLVILHPGQHPHHPGGLRSSRNRVRARGHGARSNRQHVVGFGAAGTRRRARHRPGEGGRPLAARRFRGWDDRRQRCLALGWRGSRRRACVSRVVLVTGGSRGIGLACAQRFAALGDRVAVTYNSSPPPDGLFAVACDVTSVESVDAAFKAIEAEFGHVEVLVSNAGITKDGLLLRMSEADFGSVVDANLTAAYRVAKRATQGMLRARAGRIIFMSSVVALLGSAGQANYAASKAGLVGLARSLARELGSRSITVNVVAPGPVETDMTAALGDKRLAELTAAVPLARMAYADEIAGVVAFLASSDAAYITGAVIPVDGGLGMGH